jgi:hypothetical protein
MYLRYAARMSGSRWICALAVLAAGCGDDDGGIGPLDGGDDPADAAPPGTHVVYMNFDGVFLMSGVRDIPIMDISGSLSNAYDMPPFLDGDSGRAATITAILDTARATLAPYDVELVTERPATGLYDMIAFGGSAADAGLEAGLHATYPLRCDDAGVNIVLVFDDVLTDTDDYAYTVVSAIGGTNRIPLSSLAGDCMCWTGKTCVFDGEMCTIGGAGTPVNTTDWICEGLTEMDEHALFLAELGAAE